MSNGDGYRPERPEPGTPRPPGRKWLYILGGLAGVFVVLAGYDVMSSRSAMSGAVSAASAVSPARTRATVAAGSGKTASAARPSPSMASGTGQASASAGPSATRTPAHELSVQSAEAFGPEGTSDGDNAAIASRVIEGGAQAWYSSWYTTAEFGALQSGTGILLDMGKTVTVSRVRLVLGAAVGADIKLRVGDEPTPAGLSTVASATDVGGTVPLRVSSAATGRYVLVWFTRLPPNPQGKYQVSVYSATVDGDADG